MKCMVCDKLIKKWGVCETCLDVLRKKYPTHSDLVRAIKKHKQERRLK